MYIIDFDVAQLTNRLAVEASRKQLVSSSFYRACAAYSYITIPAIRDVYDRLNLYIETGQVALMNYCLTSDDRRTPPGHHGLRTSLFRKVECTAPDPRRSESS